jgi:hypothetical protein
VIVKNTPVLGSLFLYYIKNISSPLKWTIVSLIFQVTWNAFFLNTPLYQRFLFNDSNSLSIGSFVQSLITCFTVTAIGFLLKALLMRFFAVGFHRGAYYGRIRNALLVEYVLTKMLTGTRQARTMPAMRAFANKLSSVRQFVSAVRPVQSMNDLQQHVRKPSITDANIAITYEDDNNGDGGANGTQNPKKSNSGGIQGWLHRNRPKETFMLDSLPVTKNELLARSPISNYKLAGFVEFIKRNDFSFQHGVYRKAIERWERNKLGATESTELNQITIGSLRDSEGLMEIIDLQQQQQQHKRQTHSAYRRSNTAVHPPSYQMNPLSNGAAMADDTTINLEVDSLTPAQCTRMLASYIFERLHQPGSDEVTVDDFAQRMDAEISVQAFALFDGNWDGALAENEIYTTLLKIARDRKALKSALNDAETAIDKLDSAVTGFCMLVLFVSYFIIFGTDPNKVLLNI